MANIALIDDDPTEVMVLEGMLMHSVHGHSLTAFSRVEDFPSAPYNQVFDFVLLDRRIPPHADFQTSLPILAKAGYTGPIVPISAGYMDTIGLDPLNVLEPVEKSRLLTPEAVDALIASVTGATKPA
ncbi:hypothetical protein NHF40_11520 [Maricaulaceae bacterium EIL42A08]|nr:hypothetical protein [Maricaulaceae bacterium EIL42A08]MCP2678088.1 hypothetical protein [Maricaulaceae bacterium NA33B04]